MMAENCWKIGRTIALAMFIATLMRNGMATEDKIPAVASHVAEVSAPERITHAISVNGGVFYCALDGRIKFVTSSLFSNKEEDRDLSTLTHFYQGKDRSSIIFTFWFGDDGISIHPDNIKGFAKSSTDSSLAKKMASRCLLYFSDRDYSHKSPVALSDDDGAISSQYAANKSLSLDAISNIVSIDSNEEKRLLAQWVSKLSKDNESLAKQREDERKATKTVVTTSNPAVISTPRADQCDSARKSAADAAARNRREGMYDPRSEDPDWWQAGCR